MDTFNAPKWLETIAPKINESLRKDWRIPTKRTTTLNETITTKSVTPGNPNHAVGGVLITEGEKKKQNQASLTQNLKKALRNSLRPRSVLEQSIEFGSGHGNSVSHPK
jgi:hypothetical protein